MSAWNTSKCEACGKPAEKCCGKDDQPMLWFCTECYARHVKEAHGGR